LSFERTAHLRNPLNENKPVKISRDGQELPPDVGVALCAMLDKGASEEAERKKYVYNQLTFLILLID